MIVLMTNYLRHTSFALVMLLMFLSSCFTGVESTKKITDKDVKKVVEGLTQEELEANTLSIPTDSFANWKTGKQFFVCDNNARLIFKPTGTYDIDTLNLKGCLLSYVGYHLGSVLDNRNTVNIEFSDGRNKLVYSTDKTIDEIKSTCSCGRKTIVNARIDHKGRIVTDGNQVEIGGDDKYVALCRHCWHSRRLESADENALKFTPE